jgi:hypothetical protein
MIFGLVNFVWGGDVLLAAKQVLLSNVNHHRFFITKVRVLRLS